MEPQTAPTAQPPSPSRSDKSTDSEGKPVREKLKGTRIDAKNSADKPMNDASTNGAYTENNSGSDSDRGRLRRKRSHEAFEEGEYAKNPEKKQERHHQRKKSRDVTSPLPSDRELAKAVKSVVPPISEHQTDDSMQTTQETAKPSKNEREGTPEASDNRSRVASPKNKRSREEAEVDAAPASDHAAETSKDTLTEEERTTKRLRDGIDPPVAEATDSKTKIPPGSGFANTSTISPFATMTTHKPAPKPAEPIAKDLPQTSSQAFKSSGFGSFASASASPFAAAASGSGPPFGGPAGAKLSSFASGSSTSAARPSGFASLGGSTSSTPSAFGGSTNGSGKSVFGGALGSTSFGGISTGPSKLSSFGSGGASITGLTQKPVDFGSKEAPKATDEEESDNNDDDVVASASESAERKTSSAILQAHGPIETGEENEDAAWVGRAKLYTLAGEKGKKGWHERGMGPFKLNFTREKPTRARFVLRADGTHRLLLNAAVTKTLKFGDAEGKEPKDGKFLFTSPTTSGEMESHLLKIRTEKANELWNIVEDLKKSLA